MRVVACDEAATATALWWKCDRHFYEAASRRLPDILEHVLDVLVCYILASISVSIFKSGKVSPRGS